jgi:hypothetical protein
MNFQDSGHLGYYTKALHKMGTTYVTMQRHTPEDQNHGLPCCENHKTCIMKSHLIKRQ